MQLTSKIFAIFTVASFAGCSFPSPSRLTYNGTVERVVERQGDFLSPVKGHRPLYCIYLRIYDPAGDDIKNHLQIWVLDFYAPAIYGKAGDRVQFQYVGKLPINQKLEFDSLLRYILIPNRG
jgi:hypothetical protein